LRERQVPHVGQGVAAPQLQPGAELLGRLPPRPRLGGAPARVHQAVEPVDVDGVGRDPQAVSPTGRPQQVGAAAERLAQAADVRVRGGDRAAARVVGEQRVHDLLGRHGLPPAQEQQREQRLGPGSADRHGLATAPHLDRAEQAELDRGGAVVHLPNAAPVKRGKRTIFAIAIRSGDLAHVFLVGGLTTGAIRMTGGCG
jgi:hypothetical protein